MHRIESRSMKKHISRNALSLSKVANIKAMALPTRQIDALNVPSSTARGPSTNKALMKIHTEYKQISLLMLGDRLGSDGLRCKCSFVPF